MRILTYADPFALREDPELWNLMTGHPLYCASDTLVQGLSHYYGRLSFGIIRPLQELLERYMKAYVKNPVNDMQLYLTICSLIRSLPDGPMKQSFLFNKAQVNQAIRLLIPLEADPDSIEKDLITREEQTLLEIYERILKSRPYQEFAQLKRNKEIDFQEAVRLTSGAEILYKIRTNSECEKEIRKAGFTGNIEHIGEIKSAGEVIFRYYDNLLEEVKAAEIRRVLDYCNLQPDEYYSTIVIAGVHRFTPEIYYLVRDLEEKNIQVVFAIPYASDLPAVYDTWKRVYAWTEAKLEHVKPLSPNIHSEARELVGVLSGHPIEPEKDHQLLTYGNMTAFALNDVSITYREAKRNNNNNDSTLNGMKIQYYAVQGDDCNELLKMFYPEQFEEKPFLSYPIGQLILGIYRMWDFEKGEIRFNVNTLIECSVAGIFQDNIPVAPVLRKLKLYLRGAETRIDYQRRFQALRDFHEEAMKREALQGLTRLSFFSVTPDELNAVEDFLRELTELATKLFVGQNKAQINYIDHFRRMMELISDAANSDNRLLQKQEVQLIQGIRERLSTQVNGQAEGPLADVADALAFFLSNQKNRGSHWIVRDFEQIDGAVLLSKKGHNGKESKAQAYHFALLSNEHMLKQSKDELPWPLTLSFFDSCKNVMKGIQAVTASIREHRNFLKFSLFYGVYFSAKKPIFSYIEEEDGEKQTPYYLFTAMGYPQKTADVRVSPHFSPDAPAEDSVIGKSWSSGRENLELFAICPFKYLMHAVLGAELEYASEYHVSYFLRYYLTYLARQRKSGNTVLDKVTATVREIQPLFPFMGETSWNDLIRDATADLSRYSSFNPTVHQRKLNFLVAGWNAEDWKPTFRLTDENQIQQYLTSPELYPSQEQLPKHTFCEYCNFEGICLRDYYQDHTLEQAEKPEEIPEEVP